MKLVTAATMREMDRRTIEDFDVPGIVLMENAALRVVEAIVERYGPLDGKRVIVLCGKGNNGGDGFAIARHLMLRYGARVDAHTTISQLPNPMQTPTTDAEIALNAALSAGVPITRFEGDKVAPNYGNLIASADIIVDAIFGTGFRGTADGLPAQLIDYVNRCRTGKVVAVDIPSGVNADSGAVDGPAIEADLTVTFALAKPGLVCYPGAANVGELVVADISMPHLVVDEAPAFAHTTEAADVAAVLPSRENGRDTNKGKFGHVLVVAGSRGFLGAANMSAHAAARTGAGLVTLSVPDSLLTPAMSTVNPVIMTRGLTETKEGTFAKAAVDEVLKLAEKVTAVAIGPGIGAHVDETAEFVREVIRRCPVPVVVDADALNVLSNEADHGQSILAGRSASTVLTPHPGEMGRLIGKSTADVQADRFGVAKDVADRYRCTVLLKGARTVIASPEPPDSLPFTEGPGVGLNINTTGNPGMASGGMGDALTGVIGALLGMKIDPHEAASAGAYVHGLAGDIAVDRIGGKAGLIATDLIDSLPAAIAKIIG